MRIKNYQYFVGLDSKGLIFKPSNYDTLLEFRLNELNELNLRFVMSFSIRHEKTDLPVIIAIFEEKV